MGVIGRTCPECGDHFTTNRADRHYCSDDCRNGTPDGYEMYGPDDRLPTGDNRRL